MVAGVGARAAAAKRVAATREAARAAGGRAVQAAGARAAESKEEGVAILERRPERMVARTVAAGRAEETAAAAEARTGRSRPQS